MNYDAIGRTLNGLMNGMKTTVDRFRSDAGVWWMRELSSAKRRNLNPPTYKDAWSRGTTKARWQKAARERKKLFDEIVEANALACRREYVPPPQFVKDQLGRIARLRSMQAVAGIHEHPSVLGETGLALLHARRFSEAIAPLQQAIGLRGTDGDLIARRENVADGLALTRAQQLTGRDEEAATSMARALDLSKTIRPDIEEKEVRASDTHPGADFVSSRCLAWFGEMDRIIHSKSWDADLGLRGQFVFYRDRSRAEFDAPEKWSPPMRIAVLSDDVWLARMEDYVVDIAESLFKRMARNPLERFVRRARLAFWGRFIETPHAPLASAAATLLVFLSYAHMTSDPSTTADPGRTTVSAALDAAKATHRELGNAYTTEEARLVLGPTADQSVAVAFRAITDERAPRVFSTMDPFEHTQGSASAGRDGRGI